MKKYTTFDFDLLDYDGKQKFYRVFIKTMCLQRLMWFLPKKNASIPIGKTIL